MYGFAARVNFVQLDSNGPYARQITRSVKQQSARTCTFCSQNSGRHFSKADYSRKSIPLLTTNTAIQLAWEDMQSTEEYHQFAFVSLYSGHLFCPNDIRKTDRDKCSTCILSCCKGRVPQKATRFRSKKWKIMQIHSWKQRMTLFDQPSFSRAVSLKDNNNGTACWSLTRCIGVLEETRETIQTEQYHATGGPSLGCDL